MDNGDFNVAHIDDEREPLRVNNPNGSTFEGWTALLDISGSGFENSFDGGTLEIVVNTDAAEAVESGDITLTLSDTDQGVVREFTASFDDCPATTHLPSVRATTVGSGHNVYPTDRFH